MNPPPKGFDEWLKAATAGLDRNIRQRLELELSSHYQDALDELIASGLNPAEAARKALEQLGDAASARDLYREEYAAEMPWHGDFLPKRLDSADYGYVKGNELVGCTQTELIEACKCTGINGREVTLAWTPQTERVVPVERIPFLFEAIKEKRRKSAQWELTNACMWGALIAAPLMSSKEPVNWRHIFVFLGLATALPAVQAIKNIRAARALTPESLAREAGEGFPLWSGMQTARLTMCLIGACLVVMIMQMVALIFEGSAETAALVKEATWGGEWWRLLTSIFVHGGFMHLIFNIVGLGLFGHLVEVTLGRMHVAIVFLLTALTGAFFSLCLNPYPSVGASGGIFGLAGFLFMIARRPNAFPLPEVQHIIVNVACFAALTGIIAYDLFDSAAHLGGLLGGLTLGWLMKDPLKVAATFSFRLAGWVSCAVLLAGALLAMLLMTKPVPQKPPSAAPPREATTPRADVSSWANTRRHQNGGRINPVIHDRWPATPASCINLEAYGNAVLPDPWQHPLYSATLRALPNGPVEFNGVTFDARSIIQLRGSNVLTNFPAELSGIRIEQRAQRIHFLHATGGVVPDGTIIGEYIVRFANGAEEKIPIIYGHHLREWHAKGDSAANISSGEIAWSVETSCHPNRLYQSAWTNPLAAETIESISFVSTLTECFPFLVAMTVDPPEKGTQ